jgi:hypothetical protein
LTAKYRDLVTKHEDPDLVGAAMETALIRAKVNAAAQGLALLADATRSTRSNSKVISACGSWYHLSALSEGLANVIRRVEPVPGEVAQCPQHGIVGAIILCFRYDGLLVSRIVHAAKELLQLNGVHGHTETPFASQFGNAVASPAVHMWPVRLSQSQA